jgi:hypothetical protein
MMVVALAHQEEIRALHARDRAWHRLLVIGEQFPAITDARGVEVRRAHPVEVPIALWRRWVRAHGAYLSAMRALWSAQTRHSKWYRAYLRARRRAA